MSDRKTPYTARGISRVTCYVRWCDDKATAQFQVCADNNVYRPLCVLHDLRMNTKALEVLGMHPVDVASKMTAYAISVGRDPNTWNPL